MQSGMGFSEVSKRKPLSLREREEEGEHFGTPPTDKILLLNSGAAAWLVMGSVCRSQFKILLEMACFLGFLDDDDPKNQIFAVCR